jgi:hypothetical protein
MFKSVFILAIVSLIGTVSLAQQLQKPEIVIPENHGLFSSPAGNGRGTVWMEVSFPMAKTGPFADALQEQKNKARGAPGTLTFGWEPLAKRNVPLVLKHLGVSADMTMLQKPGGFDNPLFSYTVYDEIPVERGYEYLCYGRSNCGYCGYSASYACVYQPRTVTVAERDAHIKYSSGSMAIGMYVPVEIARRISVQGGLNMRFHSIVEGIRTDRLDGNFERSTGATLKVGYIWKKATVAFSMERSIDGVPYRSKAVGVGIRF